MVVTADAAPLEQDSSAPAEPTREPRTRRYLLAATLAAVVPVVVAGVRAALRGWTPTGDDAYSAVRAWDVFTTNPPLLGTWSSAALYTQHNINHPGPLQFDLLAIPVRLLGHGAGTAVGIALVNAVAVGLIGWLVYRRVGIAGATLALGFSALLTWSMGSEMLYSPWSQYSPIVPFGLFLVAVWCAVAGDWVALPIMVVAGNYSLQTHLSYSILVPGLLAFALGAVVLRVLRRRRRDPDGWPDLRRRSLRWAAVTGGAQLVVGVQPLIEQITAPGEGNVAALARSASADAPHPTLGATVRAVGGTVALPPAWLPPSYGSPSFDVAGNGRPTWLAALGLVVLAAVLGGLGWRAWRRGSTAVAAGAATGLFSLALALVTVREAPIRWGMAPTYLRWMWPLGMALWLIVAVAVLDELRARRAATSGTADSDGADSNGAAQAARAALPVRWALPGLAIAVVAGCATLPRTDHGSSSPDWTVEAIDSIGDDVVAAVEDDAPVLVQITPSVGAGALGPPVLVELQDAGVPFYVEDSPLVRQLGRARQFDLGDATTTLRVAGGRAAGALPGERLVATWSELGDEQSDELEQLNQQVEDLVAEHGLPLTDDAVSYLRRADQHDVIGAIEVSADDPEAAVDNGTVRGLWAGGGALLRGEPLIDTDLFPAELMDRWVDLWIRHDERVVKVYVGTVQTFDEP